MKRRQGRATGQPESGLVQGVRHRIVKVFVVVSEAGVAIFRAAI